MNCKNEKLRSLNDKDDHVTDGRSEVHSFISKQTFAIFGTLKCFTTSSFSLQRKANVIVREVRLEAELKIHEVESEKTAGLKKPDQMKLRN